MQRPARVLSVDLLRGLTIALMILVNDPGDWEHVFRQLDHADWNGWTLTDLVFPTFLLLVGASIVFSTAARELKGDCRKTQLGHIWLRFAKLFLLAEALQFFPRMNWQRLRFFGVLPRIALCYLLGALIVLAVWKSRRRVLWLAGMTATILIGYYILLRWVPVPGLGMPVRDIPFMDPEKDLAAWLDRTFVAWTQATLHTGVLYRKVRDPEGLLSTLPAVGTVLLGALTGLWYAQERRRRLLGLVVAGVLGVLAGTLWGYWFPINKNLWTSSYVLLAAGWAWLALAACSWLVDDRPRPWSRGREAITWPWFVFGSNAIVAFTVSAVLVKIASRIKLAEPDGKPETLWTWSYDVLFARHGSTVWTSLAFAIAFTLLCFIPNWLLWRKRWFVRL